jgi:hypothetical protein
MDDHDHAGEVVAPSTAVTLLSLYQLLVTQGNETARIATGRHAEVLGKLGELNTSMIDIRNHEQKFAWFQQIMDTFGISEGLEKDRLWQFVEGIPGDIRPECFPTSKHAMGQMLTRQKGIICNVCACGVGGGSTTFYWSLKAKVVPENVLKHPKYPHPRSDSEAAEEDDADSDSHSQPGSGSEKAAGSSSDSEDEGGTNGEDRDRFEKLKKKLKANKRGKKVVNHFLHATVHLKNGNVTYETETPAVHRKWEEFLASNAGMELAAAQLKANEELHDGWLGYVEEHGTGSSSEEDDQDSDVEEEPEEAEDEAAEEEPAESGAGDGNAADDEGQDEDDDEQEHDLQVDSTQQGMGGSEGSGTDHSEKGDGADCSAGGKAERENAQAPESNEDDDEGGYQSCDYGCVRGAPNADKHATAPPDFLLGTSPKPSSSGAIRTRNFAGKMGLSPAADGGKKSCIRLEYGSEHEDGSDAYGGVTSGQPGYSGGYQGL